MFFNSAFSAKTYCPLRRFILASHLHHGSLLGFLDETLGVIAQLVERLNGIEEVWGSNPHGSTKRLMEASIKQVCVRHWG